MNAQLQARLWAEFNAGCMPVALRMAYALYCDLMKNEPEFEDLVELGEERPSYQGLPIYFDNWYPKEPHITTEPITK